MHVEMLREYCLQKQDVEECFPFDEDTLVFKVNNRMFILISLETSPLRFNVKCDPEKALELREQYACILPGYHMDKKHWNTVVVDGTLSDKQLFEMVDESYQMIQAKTKKQKS